MSKHIAVIVEGGKREIGYWHSVQKNFFPDTDINIVPLSAEKNLYMIWNQLKEDNFETDTIELIRESSDNSRVALDGLARDDFQEIYLFFDYDPQQNNLGLKGEDAAEVLSKLLQTFDNETENGKLYISYPMSEALRDINNLSCIPLTNCLITGEELAHYKTYSGTANVYSDYRKYDWQTWGMFISIFLKRCQCLFKKPIDTKDFLLWFKASITPSEIYKKEEYLYRQKQNIFILSAFPEFLLDYFRTEYFQKEYFLPTITDPQCVHKAFFFSE